MDWMKQDAVWIELDYIGPTSNPYPYLLGPQYELVECDHISLLGIRTYYYL